MKQAKNALVRNGQRSDLGFDGVTRYQPGTSPTALWAPPICC